jgi:hypothetical protein
MSSISQNIRICENTVEFPMKKSVRWATKLVEVREYEKPFRKGSYGELSQRLGKPERIIGKPMRVPVKLEDKQYINCICT